MKATVINIVSGKGGTGKTLLTAVVADMLGNTTDTAVAVVDLDIFVRGLTSLLYYRRGEKLSLVDEAEVSTSDFLFGKWSSELDSSFRLSISRYRSFYVVPAVNTIDQVFESRDISPRDQDQARRILDNLLDQIPSDFNYVILDSRAGYDDLVAAAHAISDFSICVEEPDQISMITADNLIAQLRTVIDRPVLRVINKARPGDVGSTRRQTTDLGSIPFDMDILTHFGEPDFWDRTSNSMYKSAIVDVWNRLAGKVDLPTTVEAVRVSPVVFRGLEPRLGRFTTVDRILVMYGVTFSTIGFAYGLFGEDLYFVFVKDPLRFASLGVGVAGLVLTVWTMLRIRRRSEHFKSSSMRIGESVSDSERNTDKNI